MSADSQHPAAAGQPARERAAARDGDRRAVIVSAVRAPVGRSPRGQFTHVSASDLGAHVVAAAVRRARGVPGAAVEDVLLGCAFPEAEQGLNLGRLVALRAGLPDSVAGLTVNRFCASGLQAIAQAAERIESGRARCLVAGGVESMTAVPMTGHVFRPDPVLFAQRPEAFLGMGLTAERVAQRHGITRQDQDAFALRSHQRALAAQQAGRFRDEIEALPAPNNGSNNGSNKGANTGASADAALLAHDEGPRRDTSLESLARLRPVFQRGGSVTAGNSSQTSDGAAALLLMSESAAAAAGLAPLARLLAYAVVGVAPDVMGEGPILAVPAALQQAGLSLDQIDLFELNEAFAAQALACARALELPDEKLNVNGGAIALGHPLGATGARLTVTLLAELQRRRGRYGVVTLCVGGGMGVAAVFERLDGAPPSRARGD